MLGSLVRSQPVEILVGLSVVDVPVATMLGLLAGSLVEILVGYSLVGVPVLVDSLVKGVLAAGLSAKGMNT